MENIQKCAPFMSCLTIFCSKQLTFFIIEKELDSNFSAHDPKVNLPANAVNAMHELDPGSCYFNVSNVSGLKFFGRFRTEVLFAKCFGLILRLLILTC